MIDPELLLDSKARQRLVLRFGEVAVGAWFDELPALVDRLATRWGLVLETALPGGTSRTFRCRRTDGGLAVLKLVPERQIAATEAAALRAWSGAPGVVELLDADLDAGALLLECLVPGTPLLATGQQITLSEIGSLLRQLHIRPTVEYGFPSLADRLDFMFDLIQRRRDSSPAATAAIPTELIDRSRRAALALAGGNDPVLLHGDLHTGNVLDAGPGRGFVVIDPRPCLGDPAFDAIDWVLCPAGPTGPLEVATVDTRAHRLATELPAVDADRLVAWCRALAVIVAVIRLQQGCAPNSGLLALAP